ncbi:MAG: acyl carrier protein [Caldisericia bacterium]|nr:acyl carrier protein [Caldisericia bacterium]
MINNEKFLSVVADSLELEENEISFDTDFRNEVEDFDSLMGFSVIVAFDENFQKKMPVAEFMKCRTVKDLYDFINRE